MSLSRLALECFSTWEAEKKEAIFLKISTYFKNEILNNEKLNDTYRNTDPGLKGRHDSGCSSKGDLLNKRKNKNNEMKNEKVHKLKTK